MGLLVAIGCLNKMPIVKDFENGICIRTFVDYLIDLIYELFKNA